MKVNIFKQKVKKHLWFLNKKEKQQLDQVLSKVLDKNHEEELNRPMEFSNQFLKNNIFEEKVVTLVCLLMLLIVILITYIILLELFLFSLLTILSSVQFFIKLEVDLSSIIVVLTLIGALLLLVISLYLIKVATVYFTKKLLEYKHNRAL